MQEFGLCVLAAFTLIVLITLASMDYGRSASDRRRMLREVFAPLAGVVIGAALSGGFTLWSLHNSQRTEFMRARASVDQELGTNIDLISDNVRTLQLDDTVPPDQEVVQPLYDLLTSAGETAYLHGSFEPFSKDFAIKLGNTYSTLLLLNKRIDDRDTYRLYNQNMTNYSRRRRLLNADLETRLAKAFSDVISLRVELMKLEN